jgi:tRNA(Ile)-lysidine synthetase-like protein
MAALTTRVRAFIAAHQLIRPGAPVVVAVSGGPDSLCLLALLRDMRAELGVELHVAHLDHMIRGAESADEARFVARLAAEWGLPATVAAADVPALARAGRQNLHAAARVARYAFLAEVARAAGAQAVAVAHHAGDQAETVLLHLLRGAGAEGLRGMRPAVGWEEWAGSEHAELQIESDAGKLDSQFSILSSQLPRLIRPLLEITRAEIEAECAERALAPRYDPSNLALDATRNRIRHDLLPRLIEYNPHIVMALGRTAAISADEHEFIGAALDTAWAGLARPRANGVDFDGAAWRALHPALQRAAIRRAHALLAPGAPLGFDHVERARALVARGVGRRAELPGGVALDVGYGGDFTLGEPAPADAPQLAAAVGLPAAGRLDLGGGWALIVERLDAPAPAGGPWEVALDAARLAEPLIARPRRPGDRLAIEAGHRRLQDVFVDAKVPRDLRAGWPVIATSAGVVVWVAGLRAAAGYAAGPASAQVVCLRLTRDGASPA